MPPVLPTVDYLEGENRSFYLPHGSLPRTVLYSGAGFGMREPPHQILVGGEAREKSFYIPTGRVF